MSYPLLMTRRRLRGSPSPPLVDARLVELLLMKSSLHKRQVQEFEKASEYCIHCTVLLMGENGGHQALLPTTHPSAEQVRDYALGRQDTQVNRHCLLCSECTQFANLLLNACELMK